MSAIEQGFGLQSNPDNDDELIAYDVYAVPQPDGTFEAHIVDSHNKVEFYSRGYPTEADACIAAAQWFQRYINTGGDE